MSLQKKLSPHSGRRTRSLIARSIAGLCLSAGLAQATFALGPNEIPIDALKGLNPHTGSLTAKHGAAKLSGFAAADAGTIQNAATQGSGVPGIDSVANFTGSFVAAGLDPLGNPQSKWYYAMVGSRPDDGRAVSIDAPIIPVVVKLLDASGNVLVVNNIPMISDGRKDVGLVLDSPVFAYHHYSTSEAPTQITDAIQRASFWNRAEDSWHTMLRPQVATTRVIELPFGSYYYGLNPDGTLAFVLASDPVFSNLLFPPTYPVDNTTILGAAELAGEVTTKTIATLLFDNVYLYENNDPNQCCVLGYHEFDAEPGTAANGNLPRFYVMNYSSWISPGLFGGGFQDVTALSHEMAEIFADPFVGFDNVHNITPWWLSPSGGQCNDILEVGDVIEGNATPTYPITMNGYVYHPQNETLLSWFEFQSPSRAFGHAYSYPDPTQVPALSPVETVNCK